MKTRLNWIARLFVAVMLCFSLLMAGFVVARSRLDFTLEDTARSLETSQGRERKQQKEYDEVVEQLPKTRAELAEIQPQADEAAETVRQLKEERKRLRAEKKALEQALEEKQEKASEKNPEEAPEQNPENSSEDTTSASPATSPEEAPQQEESAE